MSQEIIYRDMTNSDVICCKTLCNKLMQHQASVAVKYPELLSGMNFDNRLKASFDAAQCKKLIVAYCNEKPIGYIYGEIFEVTENNAREFKPFSNQVSEEDAKGYGLIPPTLELPTYIADLVNLYVEPEYRSEHVGKELVQRMQEWFEQNKKAKCWCVYVSNGNNPGTFYEKFGYSYSHEVLNGFITCYTCFVV